MNEMTEWRIRWQQTPFIHYQPNILFVRAATAEIALAVAKDYIEHTFGYGNYAVREVEQYVKPVGGVIVSI